MYFLQNVKRNSAIRNVVIVLAAIAIGAAASGDALAAGHHAARGAGHIRGGQVSSPIPSTPPIFNPSYPYTVPQAPETPVSPASPGSVFGN